MNDCNSNDFGEDDVFVEKNLQSRGNFEEFDLDEHRKNLGSPIKSLYESIDGWDDKDKSMSIRENNYLQDDVFKNLHKMRIEYCEDEKSANNLIDKDDKTNRRSSRKSFTTHEYILKDTLSSQEDSPDASEDILRDKMKRRRYKAIIPQPRVEVSGGFAVFKAWVDLSAFRMSLTNVRVYVNEFSSRLLVVEAVERGFKNRVTNSFKKCFRLPRFCDVYDIRHRINIMGVLKIEIPLIYFSESLTEETKGSKQETKATIYTPRKSISEEMNIRTMISENGWENKLNEKSKSSNADPTDKENYEIIVKLPEHQSIDNVKVLIQNNIIIITEIITSDAKYNSVEDENMIEDDEIVTNHQLTPRKKMRFVKMYKVPKNALKDTIQCNTIDAKTLKISIPLMD